MYPGCPAPVAANQSCNFHDPIAIEPPARSRMQLNGAIIVFYKFRTEGDGDVNSAFASHVILEILPRQYNPAFTIWMSIA
jgi:hypothetical protein